MPAKCWRGRHGHGLLISATNIGLRGVDKVDSQIT